MRPFAFVFLAFAALSPALSHAQSYDPWPDYDGRNIRQLRNEASDRREKLRELAKKSHTERSSMRTDPLPVRIRDEASVVSSVRPVNRPVPAWSGEPLPPRHPDGSLVLSLFQTPAPVEVKTALDDEFGPPMVYENQDINFSARPVSRPLPSWRGPVLAVDAERWAYLNRFSDSTYVRATRGFQNVKSADGYVVLAPSLVAKVNVSKQRMVLFEGDRVIAEWPVSTGRSGHESTRGTFGVNFLSRNHKSRQYNMAPMPCAVFYNKGEAVHGTTAVGQLGRKASHGCVRLATKNACTLYDMVAERGKDSLIVEVFD